MTDIEVDESLQEQPRRLRWDWVLPLFFKPRRTLEKVVAQEKAVWLVPLLILSVFAVIVVLVAGPIRQQAALTGGNLPVDFQYWLPEEQERYMATQASMNGPAFTYAFPALGAVLGIWIRWFLLGIVLHLALTLAGSRSSNTSALNLVGWSSLPYALRSVVQVIGMWSTKSLISKAGLSGFIASEAGGFGAFLGAVLVFVDIYLIWQVILLLVGVVPMSHLSRGKAWMITIITVLLVIGLFALPSFLASQIGGGGSTITPFFF